MKLYKKYILKLLFSRFAAIMLCVSVFGVFQEFAKGKLLLMCTFWQTMLILPLMLPMILFQFLPFIYFGTLLLVQNELYSNNELIGFKTTGLSNRQIMRVFLLFSCFVLFVFVLLGIVYPYTNGFFSKTRSAFGVKNVLKTIQPRIISQLGEYKILCDRIDKNGILYNVSIFFDKTNNISFGATNNVELNKKIIFSKKMFFGYNKFDELVARLVDDDIAIIKFDGNFDDKSCCNNDRKIQGVGMQNEENLQNCNPELRQVIHVKKMDALFDDFLQLNNYGSLAYKQKIRQTDVMNLFKIKANSKSSRHIKQLEIHSRVIVYWFIITALTFVCCLLLKRQTNRVPSLRCTSIVIVIGFVVSLSRAFVLDVAITNNFTVCLYYLHFVAICVVCWMVVKKSDFNCV